MRAFIASALLACAAQASDVVLAHFTFDEDAFVNHVDTPILGFDRVSVDESGYWHRWDITIHGWCKIEKYKENMAWHVVYGNQEGAENHCMITTKSPITIPFFYDQCKFSLQVTDLDYKYFAKNTEEWWSVNEANKESDDFMCFSVLNAENKIISTAKQCQYGDIARRRRLADYEYERPVTTGEHAELSADYGSVYADVVHYMTFHEYGSVEKTHIIESPYIGIDELKGGIKVTIEAGTDHASEHWYADDMKIECTPRAPVNCKANEYYYGRVADEGFCSHCPAGRYSDGCTDCEKNTVGFGPTMCEIRGLTCAKGSFAVAKIETGELEGHSCHQCPGGYFSNVVHSDECLGCSAGTYQAESGQTECTQCESGRFAETDLATTCTSCTTTAFSCLAGSKSVTALGSKFSSACQCETCGVGTFNAEAKSEDCTNCAAGTFQDSEGGASCKICGRGEYSGTTGSVSCTKCPEGTHTDASSSDSLDKCIAKDCPPGQYEKITPGGDSHCTNCAAGRYGGKDERKISRCISCPEVTLGDKLVGTYAHEAGMSQCKPCPQATDSASSHDTVPNAAKTSCTANWCHAGRYKYFHPQTKMDYCLPCPAGKFGSVEHPSVGGVCTECDSGKFQFTSAKKSCDSCPTDYWTSNVKGAAECIRAPTAAPTTTPTASPTKTPTAPPTAYPTPPTPAPTPVHFMPGLAATVTLTNVTVQEFPAHQHIFELAIAEALGCKQHDTTNPVCTWTDAHVDEVKTTTNEDCDRVLFSGIAADHEQGDRMGYYYRTHDNYEGRPVYQQNLKSGESNFLYWTHKGWVVGPKAGGRIAGLISPSVGADDATEITKEWYTFITNAEWLDGNWIPAPTLKMECAPAPKITVWFNIHNKDCSEAGRSKMDLFPQRLKDLIALPYHAGGNLVNEFHKGGLLATHLEPVYSTIVSCAPIIKLSLGRHFVQHSHETHIKSSCRFDGSDIHVDSKLEKNHQAVAIKGSSQTGMLLNAVPGDLVSGTKYRLTLDGTGQVEDVEGKFLQKIGTMAKNCENRFVPEKGVWRCECYHYDSDENVQTRTHATLPPSNFPTASPTSRPTGYPTQQPTKTPTKTPTATPTNPPTNTPTATPTKVQEGWAYKEWWHMDTAN